jgi:hypothetical protein
VDSQRQVDSQPPVDLQQQVFAPLPACSPLALESLQLQADLPMPGQLVEWRLQQQVPVQLPTVAKLEAEGVDELGDAEVGVEGDDVAGPSDVTARVETAEAKVVDKPDDEVGAPELVGR